MIIDTIGTSYDSIEELINRKDYIENKVLDYIQDKNIATGYESTVSISKDNRYYLTIKILK